MPRLVVVFLICLLCLQNLLRVGVVAYYECNKAYISRFYCENKSRPELKCCGKCYLRKQLKKIDEADQKGKGISEILSKFQMPPYLAPEPLQIAFVASEEALTWEDQSRDYFPQWKSGIEHPPG
jgi:hypothetical protein